MKKAAKGLILGALVAAASVGLVQTNAMAAGNISDTSFYFEFTNLSMSATATTGDRAKNDATSSYMKCDSVGGSYTYDGWVELYNGSSVNGTHYTFNDNTTKYMSNYAFEKYGKTSVHIKAETGFNSVHVVASGVWSPDSI